MNKDRIQFVIREILKEEKVVDSCVKTVLIIDFEDVVVSYEFNPN
jgi:hypothetical protein